ncbi:MAG: family 10 glycosylhydrolase [Armatimonadetes bacterium]|nr:family 10 glycosylhydrolase [Armatimonadota bacterium]
MKGYRDRVHLLCLTRWSPAAGAPISGWARRGVPLAAVVLLAAWGVAHRTGVPGRRVPPSPGGSPAAIAPEPEPGPPVPVSPRVVLVEPARPAATEAARSQARTAFGRVSGFLDLSGVPYRTLPDTSLSLSDLEGAGVALLPFNVLTDGNVASLAAFVAGGGRILAIYPQAPAGLFTLLGVTSAGSKEPEFEGQLRRIAFAADDVPGLPDEMDQSSWRSLLLTPLEGTRVIGWWEGKGQRTWPAVTLNRAGMLVGHILTGGGPRQKREFLLVALGYLDGAVWGQSARARRVAALARLAEQRRRWLSLSGRPDLKGRKPRVDEFAAQARRLLEAVPPSPPSDAHHGRKAREAAVMAERALDRLESAMTPAPRGELRGFWIHTYRPTDWDAVMARAKAGGLNAAFVRVGRGGNTIYPNDFLPRDTWAEEAGGDELQRALDAARRHGLAFHAWRVVYHLGSAPEEYRQRMASEDRLVRDPDGTQSPWANPGDPRNQDLEHQVMMDLVSRYDIDGLHLDYIRYPDAPHTRFDYGAVSRREFERAAGVTVERWPADVRTRSLRARYEEWQRANISRLVERVYEGSKKRKPRVQVSAAIWRNYPWCREGVRQDWPRWVRAGWLDFVVPMNYVTDTEAQGEAVRRQRRDIGDARPLIAGIGSWQLQTSLDVLAQVRAARAAGAKGFVLFSYNDEGIAGHLDVLGAGACADDG